MNQPITQEDLVLISKGINEWDNLMTHEEFLEFINEYNEFLLQCALNDSLTEQHYGEQHYGIN